MKRAPWLRPLAALSLLAGAAAQQPEPAPGPDPLQVRMVTRPEMERLRDRGVLWDTTWGVDAAGFGVQWPNAAAGGSTEVGQPWVQFAPGPPGSAGSGDPVRRLLQNPVLFGKRDLVAAAWLATLLRAPGDLLGCTDAGRHFAQSGHDTADAALRAFAATEPTATDAELIRRERLERELALRLLRQRGAAPAPPVERVALLSRHVTPPGDADLWLWFDAGRWRAQHDVQAAIRAARTAHYWERLLAVGRGELPELPMAGAQHLVDLPGELPFEIVRCWGEVRLDQCLLALDRAGGEGPGWQLAWAAASGAFDVERLCAWLERCDVAFARDGGRMRAADTWWPGCEVAIGPQLVEVRHIGGAADAAPRAGAAGATDGAWPDGSWARAAAGGAALAARWTRAGIAFLPPRGELVLLLAPLRLRLEAPDGLEESLATARRAVAGDGSLATWQRALGAARVEAAGSGRERLEVTGADLDLAALWPLLH